MAQTRYYQPQLVFTVFLHLIVLLLKPKATASTTISGFSLEMIHRDSPGSPLYRANLSNHERLQSLLESDRSNSRWLDWRISAGANITAIRAPSKPYGLLYYVSLTFGTGSHRGNKRKYLLQMDTSTGLTWIQCKPCIKCHRQNDPKFQPKDSSTCHDFPSSDVRCRRPLIRQWGKCRFKMTDEGGGYASGALKYETFTFLSSGRGTEAIEGLIFGCARWNTLKMFNPVSAGIFGMSGDGISFMRQLSNRINGKFSYCMFPPSAMNSGFLRFGNDIRMPASTQSTQLTPDHGYYYLNLGMISLNDQINQIPRDLFTRKPDGSGGTIIHSAFAFTSLIRPAYDILRTALVNHFKPSGVHPIQGADYGLEFDLCFHMPNSFSKNFPTMTLHFAGGARHKINAEHLFMTDDEKHFFCWMIEPRNSMTILGTVQQYDTRFTYDILNNVLLFAPEDCSRDGRI